MKRALQKPWARLARIGAADGLALGREGRLLGDDRPDLAGSARCVERLVVLAHGPVGLAAGLLDGARLGDERCGSGPHRPCGFDPAIGCLEDAGLGRGFDQDGAVEHVELIGQTGAWIS